MQNGLGILADAFWYRRNFAQNEDPEAFATRIDELLVCGLERADCEWLLRMGYMVPVSQKRNKRRDKKAEFMRSALRADTLVVLTGEGESELNRCGFLANGYRHRPPHNSPGNNHGRAACIRYDLQSRELFVRDTLVLRLTATARNMETVVKRFQKDSWVWSIPCPFEDLANGARVQAVRDAVHSLNELQDPIRIKFHSCEKGSKIWYEIAEEAGPSMESLLPMRLVKAVS
jgi:hypothetical protein